ncbi:transmembrane alpha-helix domain-containing protein [Colletotrichum truncatum]|uniref:Transmembrane alpha-helix domain-containing protein n=1 Tax=Colletotrichum truncatum TaxID=5467 RepID=A0ACC3ZGM8_COLTU
MVAAKLDPNAWYQISETRVVNVSEKIDPNLQNTNQGLRVFPLAPQAWQFQPVGDVDGRYLIRLNISGVRDQLSVCWRANEINLSGTIGCMRTTESDESQQWDISEWGLGDGSYKFANVKNGSRYVLDVHPGSNLFMSSDIEGTEGVSAKQLAQHWVMTSERPVNDKTYSTIYSTPASTSATETVTDTAATGTAATAATAATGSNSSGATSNPTSGSTPDNSSSSGGLTAGGAAGIGVGVSLAVVALIGAAVFFWWRRKKANKGTPLSQTSHEEMGKGGHAPGNLSPGTINASTVPSVTSPNTPHNDYYAQEAKVLGHMQPHAHAAEAGHNPVYEAPTDTRYELDTGLHGYGGNAPAQLDDNTRR